MDKPRAFQSAFDFFITIRKEEYESQHPNESLPFPMLLENCVKRWKWMTEKEKKVFQRMSDKDRMRYESEMTNYKSANDEKDKKRKRTDTPKSSTARPRRPTPGVYLFSLARYEQMKALMPNTRIGEKCKALMALWEQSDAVVRSQYKDFSEDNSRFEKDGSKRRKKNEPGDDDDEEDDAMMT